MLTFYSNYHEIKSMRSPRVPVEEQYRLIIECCKRGMSDQKYDIKVPRLKVLNISLILIDENNMRRIAL